MDCNIAKWTEWYLQPTALRPSPPSRCRPPLWPCRPWTSPASKVEWYLVRIAQYTVSNTSSHLHLQPGLWVCWGGSALCCQPPNNHNYNNNHHHNHYNNYNNYSHGLESVQGLHDTIANLTYTHFLKIKDASYALGDDNTINGWHDARQRCVVCRRHNMTLIADVYKMFIL